MSKIVMRIEGGVVEVLEAPEGTEIELRDYDIEGYGWNDEDESITLSTDENGDGYKKIELAF
jgi:hypothetical protein